jgi:hypothetical protein
MDEGAAALGNVGDPETDDVLGGLGVDALTVEVTSPCGRTMAQSARRVVVLPAPLAPSKVVIDPSASRS